MTVAMADGYARISSASVVRFVKTGIKNIDRISIFWISINSGVVPGSLSKIPLLVQLRPGLSGIIRSKYTAILGFNDRPHSIGIHWRNSYANISHCSFGQALIPRKLRPRIAGIG